MPKCHSSTVILRLPMKGEREKRTAAGQAGQPKFFFAYQKMRSNNSETFQESRHDGRVFSLNDDDWLNRLYFFKKWKKKKKNAFLGGQKIFRLVRLPNRLSRVDVLKWRIGCFAIMRLSLSFSNNRACCSLFFFFFFSLSLSFAWSR